MPKTMGQPKLPKRKQRDRRPSNRSRLLRTFVLLQQQRTSRNRTYTILRREATLLSKLPQTKRDMSKYYCFTIWGPTPPKQTVHITYLTYQREIGEKRGRKHYQGFIAFRFPQSLNDCRYHLRECKGIGYLAAAKTLQGAIRYCQKYKTRNGKFCEIGVRPKLQG